LEPFKTQFDERSLTVEVTPDDDCCTGQVSLVGDLPKGFTISEYQKEYSNAPSNIFFQEGARSIFVDEIPCMEVKYIAKILDENTQNSYFIESQKTVFELDMMNDFENNLVKYAKPSVFRNEGKIQVTMQNVPCVPYDVVANVRNNKDIDTTDGEEKSFEIPTDMLDEENKWETVSAEIYDWLPCEDLEVTFKPSSVDGSEIPHFTVQLESQKPMEEVTLQAEAYDWIYNFAIENQTCAENYELTLLDSNDNVASVLGLDSQKLRIDEALDEFTPCVEYFAKIIARTKYGRTKQTTKSLGVLTPVGEVKADWSELEVAAADYDIDVRSGLGADDSKILSWTHDGDTCIESYNVQFTGKDKDFNSQINARHGEEVKVDLGTLEKCQNYNLEIVPNFKEITLFSGNFVAETFRKEILIRDEFDCVPQTTTTTTTTPQPKQPRAAAAQILLPSEKSGSASLNILSINVIVNLVLSIFAFNRLI